ncbi:MAG: hypothetical protein AB7O97_02520 [Planctomycetota bacterium]
MRRHRIPFALPVLATLLLGALRAQSFANFESPQVQPIRLSADGLRLYAAHTADQRLAIFSLQNPSLPVLLDEIPVGLEPVSVNARTADEVWVVGHLADAVAVVSVSQRRVVATLRVVDEPSDVVFAGGKAFVSAATTDRVHVFDATTRAPLGTIAIFGNDPRAMAVSPDGSKVYAVVQRSGNGTTLVPATPAPPQPAPTNPQLPAAPDAGLIVRADDPAWAAQIPFTLPDHDVAEIDVATQTVTRYFDAVGTTNTGIAVHPTSGDLWVANIDARNLVRFEPALRGHAIDSRLTRITTGPSPTVTPFDLNPGVNYALLPNPAAMSTALSEPQGVAIDPVAGRVYVAAQGTDRIGVLDLTGNVLARVEVGGTPGAQVATLQKRGPRALALLPGVQRLYVLHKLSATIGVVDTATAAQIAEVPLGSFDPTPPAIRDGRKFLYDAKLSGNGTMSCASCHIDGDMDGIAWDLGDPGGAMQSPPAQPFPFNVLLGTFHPMKGPMTTQTLKGLDGVGPLHWRGDRQDFQAFNGAFQSLLGGSQLATADINAFAAFGTAIRFPPNPNQPLDRSYRTQPAGANQQAGATAFSQPLASLPFVGSASCATCHALPTGTNGMVITNQVINEPQSMKAPQLRNVYRKLAFRRVSAPLKSGFGLTHDGAIGGLTSFLGLSQFDGWPNTVKDDLAEFLLAFDTGTAPAVGFEVVLDQGNATDPAAIADLDLLIARAQAGDLDLVAHGVLQGNARGLRYDPAQQRFAIDAAGAAPQTRAQLLALLQTGGTALRFAGVPPGSGARAGLDRDLDGALDGDEAAVVYGNGTAGCAGTPTIAANGEARVGSTGFAVTGRGAPASVPGLFGLGFAPVSIQVAGIDLLVDLFQGPVIVELVASDARGTAARLLPLPGDPAFAGLGLFAQWAWADGCAPQGISASPGLQVTVTPQ